jgi:hypothetical protein
MLFSAHREERSMVARKGSPATTTVIAPVAVDRVWWLGLLAYGAAWAFSLFKV